MARPTSTTCLPRKRRLCCACSAREERAPPWTSSKPLRRPVCRGEEDCAARAQKGRSTHHPGHLLSIYEGMKVDMIDSLVRAKEERNEGMNDPSNIRSHVYRAIIIATNLTFSQYSTLSLGTYCSEAGDDILLVS